MDENLVLASIVKKIVNGRNDWTIEELQYQKNNPQEIETALIKERLKVPVNCDYEEIMIIPYKWDVFMRKQAKDIFCVKRFLSAPEAVALAVYHNVNVLDETVCIITDDNECIEIGIFIIGDGVFEVKSTQWLLKKEQERLPIVCDKMLRDLGLIGKIAQIIFARTSPYHFKSQNLEYIFQRPIIQVANLEELCNRGAYIQRGILQGYTKDLLLLSVISQSIGISASDGAMVQIIQADTTIPTRQTLTTCIVGSEISIRQGNNPVANKNPVISTLHFNNSRMSQRRNVEISLQIDVNYGCHIEAKDLTTNEQINVEI